MEISSSRNLETYLSKDLERHLEWPKKQRKNKKFLDRI